MAIQSLGLVKDRNKGRIHCRRLFGKLSYGMNRNNPLPLKNQKCL